MIELRYIKTFLDLANENMIWYIFFNTFIEYNVTKIIFSTKHIIVTRCYCNVGHLTDFTNWIIIRFYLLKIISDEVEFTQLVMLIEAINLLLSGSWFVDNDIKVDESFPIHLIPLLELNLYVSLLAMSFNFTEHKIMNWGWNNIKR